MKNDFSRQTIESSPQVKQSSNNQMMQQRWISTPNAQIEPNNAIAENIEEDNFAPFGEDFQE